MTAPTPSVVRYDTHTSPNYARVLLALEVLALIAGYFVFPRLPFIFEGHALTLLAGLAVVGLPAFYYAVSGEYRAGTLGHASAFVLAREFIEVPDARGEPMHFATQGLVLRVRHVRVAYTVAMLPVAEVPRGAVIELEGGGLKRRISTLTLVNASHAPSLLRDLARVASGQEPLGPTQALPPETPYRTAPQATATEPERDALDDALDDELAKMD